jgi:hypothetical protein
MKLGRQDSNLRIADPKSAALPLGDSPRCASFYHTAETMIKAGVWPFSASPIHRCGNVQQRIGHGGGIDEHVEVPGLKLANRPA